MTRGITNFPLRGALWLVNDGFWMSWFVSFFGFLLANAFGLFSGERDAMALTVSFAITFAFFQILCTIVLLADFPQSCFIFHVRLPCSISNDIVVTWILTRGACLAVYLDVLS